MTRWLTEWLPRLVARAPATIHQKLLAAFLSIVVLLIMVGAVGLQVLIGVTRHAEEVVTLQRKIAAYRQLQHDTTAQLYSVTSALLVPDDRTLEATVRQLNQFGYDFDRLQFVAKDEVELLAEVRKEYEQFIQVVPKVVELIRDGKAREGRELQAAQAYRPGWDPRDWTLDQAARVVLLCASSADGSEISRRLDRLCSAADISELVAYYRGLPLYPDQPRYALRAAEGLRSNMQVVFEAVAHRNPYPAEHLGEPAWNQLVLKALFVGSRLDPIVGLDARRNATLARMLCDYAHERWAASRPVSPELWRCVGPFAAGPVLADFRRLLERGTITEQQAATLALRDATDPDAARLLELHTALARDGRQRSLNWQRLAAAGR